MKCKFYETFVLSYCMHDIKKDDVKYKIISH